MCSSTLEPFAMDLWRHEISDWFPSGVARRIEKRAYFGALYQSLTVTV